MAIKMLITLQEEEHKEQVLAILNEAEENGLLDFPITVKTLPESARIQVRIPPEVKHG